MVPEEGIRTRRRRLNCDTEGHRGMKDTEATKDTEGRRTPRDGGHRGYEGHRGTEDTEGTTPRLKYEPKEGTYANRRKREGAHLAANRRKKQRHKTHSDFTQVRGPRER